MIGYQLLWMMSSFANLGKSGVHAGARSWPLPSCSWMKDGRWNPFGQMGGPAMKARLDRVNGSHEMASSTHWPPIRSVAALTTQQNAFGVMMNRFIAAVVLVAAVGLQAPVQASEQTGWQVEVTPYGWLMGVDGKVAVNDREASFEKDFSDLKDNVDAGFMGLIAASYNRFVLFGQYDYAALSTEGSLRRDLGLPVPPGVGVKGELDTTIATLGIGYRFDTFGENTLDVLVGVRDLKLDTELQRAASARSREMNVTDTLIMLRPSFRISERWRFNPTIAYAVGGDSDTHYELQPELQYQFADSFALRFGYRSLNYELESGNPNSTDDYRAFDGSLSGFLIGVGWTFPAHRSTVAAAPATVPAPVTTRPAAPPPVAAAPPSDADRDGVPDASDRCPNTPVGSQVDGQGCECDITVQLQFGFDSAELTAADTAELDRVATRMREITWVAGVAEGHTDSVGDDAYNLRLSERRARAVVDYLAGRGVDAERVRVVGLGEARPIAPNTTEAGRAQNRRVVLRRTDCNGA
ncbi:MAG: OmpA family protein [Pseudomonadales bacterium]|nr:OmpA family protein [Pseudomonadales bacterium]